jgi:hypothetical protein
MPSDTPLNKRRTHCDLDRHCELFLEATSLGAVKTKKTFLPRIEIKHRSFRQSNYPVNKRTNRGTGAVHHKYIFIFRQFISIFFFQKAATSSAFWAMKDLSGTTLVTDGC